jgi:hypothetical protein
MIVGRIVPIEEPDDVNEVIELFRLSYERASRARRSHESAAARDESES